MREADARVGLEEAGKRADELLDVVGLREGEECPAEGGVVELCALGGILGPESSQMRRLLVRMPLIEGGTSAVTPPAGIVDSCEVCEVRQNEREWRLVWAVIVEDG